MVRQDVEREAEPAVDPSPMGDDGEREQGNDTELSGTYLRIDEVAKRTGLSKRTLRYYEELELLERAPRSEGNYRMYRLEDVETLLRIKDMRDLLGLELEQIRELVKYELGRQEARTRFYHPDAAPETRLSALTDAEHVTREQLRLIESRIEALNKMGQSLRERLAIYARLSAEISAQIEQPKNATDERGKR